MYFVDPLLSSWGGSSSSSRFLRPWLSLLAPLFSRALHLHTGTPGIIMMRGVPGFVLALSFLLALFGPATAMVLRGGASSLAGRSSNATMAAAKTVVYLGRPPQLAVALTLAKDSGSAPQKESEEPAKDGNDTAWFRYRAAEDAGRADHEHFSGLKATGDFKQDVLAAHAAVREMAGLQGLTWDAELESVAAKRAVELASEDCQIRHMSGDQRSGRAGYQIIGENLYKAVLPPHFPLPTGVDMVDAWYAEIEDYSYGPQGWGCTKRKCRDRESPPCMIGHFTQVAWAHTSHVGCAVQECNAAPREGQILMSRVFVAVCHYGPAGNDVQMLPFPPEAARKMGLSDTPCAAPLAEHRQQKNYR